MSLEQEKIVSNTKKYFETATKHGFMTEELMKSLGEAFIKAPASSMKSLHNSFEGGLIDHSLKVTKYAVSINNILPEALKVDLSSLIKVCLLHQIGKANLYVPCKSEWHIKNQGKMYEFNEDLVSMHVGERSIQTATTNGVKFTDAEFQAIVNYDKDDSDKQAKWHSTPLGVILKQANELAMIEEKSLA